MPSDRSRAPDQTRDGYTGVVAQQGRVILDRDFNAQQGLTADRIAADALRLRRPLRHAGRRLRDQPAGAPTARRAARRFWSPPITVPPARRRRPAAAVDFLIAPGTMYLGGQRVVLPRPAGRRGRHLQLLRPAGLAGAAAARRARRRASSWSTSIGPGAGGQRRRGPRPAARSRSAAPTRRSG